MSGLKTEVEGDGTLISDDLLRELRQIEIFTQPLDEELPPVQTGVAVRLITVIRQVTEWYALTLEAAQDYIEEADPPADGTYSYAIMRDQRQIGSYTLRREYNNEITGPALSLESCANPTFDPQSGSISTWPLLVTLESETAGAKIRYATLLDGILSSWVEVDNETEISISEPATGTITIYALAFRSGRLPSDIVSAVYTVGT
jgi:hypothetical protein